MNMIRVGTAGGENSPDWSIFCRFYCWRWGF
jgi:hypothetical protein